MGGAYAVHGVGRSSAWCITRERVRLDRSTPRRAFSERCRGQPSGDLLGDDSPLVVGLVAADALTAVNTDGAMELVIHLLAP